MARILWIGDAGCSTGFARVTHAVGERLITQHGHDVHVLATNYRGDPYPDREHQTPLGLYVPTMYVPKDTYGQSRFLPMIRDVEPDIVFFINDPPMILRLLLENQWDPDRLMLKTQPIMTYLAVDGHNHPSMWGLLTKLTNVVAMSKFGQEFFPGSRLIYHGIDTDDFWPVDSQHPITLSNGDVLKTKAECKEAIGLPRDAFVVGRVDRNSGRKDMPSSWKALRPVMKAHSDVVAYYHCKPQGDEGGIDLLGIFSRDPEILPRQKVPGALDPYQGYKQQDLNAVYNSFDVFLSNSRGEGFGLTIAEAMACEIPVIAQNVSAIPEVVGPGGELIDPQREITVPFGHDQWLSDVPAFSEAIEYAYTHRRWRREKGEAGRAHILANFGWDDKAASFSEFITELLEKREAKEESADAVSNATPAVVG